jgi:nicotinamide-nucleotide amidase
MKIEIIAVGSELLTPDFVDTNSLYLTRRLNDLGLFPGWKTVVGDDPSDLAAALRGALARADLLFVMGGLGPTGDDVTREAAASVLGRGLVFDEGILSEIRKRFARRGREMTASNRRQAYVIDGAEILPNPNGTAPGQWLTAEAKRIALLPGPPRELEPMCEAHVWPRLAAAARGRVIRRVLKVTGLGESEVEDRIRGLYPDQDGLRMTILSSPGQVELHLAARIPGAASEAEGALEGLADDLKNRLGERIFSEDGEELEQVVGRLLTAAGATLAAAESCTGGLIAERITRIPGSSAYFLAGAVTYSNAAKIRTLGVPAELLDAHGAVSPEVAAAMAAGMRIRSGADIGISVTGIAGPGGATPDKPVGLVYAAIATAESVSTERLLCFGKREQVRLQSSQKALDLVRMHLQRAAERNSGP